MQSSIQIIFISFYHK